MFGMTRKLIDWCDNKFEEAVREDNNCKAAMSGAVEGLMDGAVIMFVPVTISCLIWRYKATKKQ